MLSQYHSTHYFYIIYAYSVMIPAFLSCLAKVSYSTYKMSDLSNPYQKSNGQGPLEEGIQYQMNGREKSWPEMKLGML